MNNFQDLDTEKARDLMLGKRWCMTDLSRASGVSYTRIRGLLSQKQGRIRPVTMFRLADALGVSPEALEK